MDGRVFGVRPVEPLSGRGSSRVTWSQTLSSATRYIYLLSVTKMSSNTLAGIFYNNNCVFCWLINAGKILTALFVMHVNFRNTLLHHIMSFLKVLLSNNAFFKNNITNCDTFYWSILFHYWIKQLINHINRKGYRMESKEFKLNVNMVVNQ